MKRNGEDTRESEENVDFSCPTTIILTSGEVLTINFIRYISLVSNSNSDLSELGLT